MSSVREPRYWLLIKCLIHGSHIGPCAEGDLSYPNCDKLSLMGDAWIDSYTDWHYEASHNDFEAFYAVNDFTDLLWEEFCEGCCIDPLMYLIYPIFAHAKF